MLLARVMKMMDCGGGKRVGESGQIADEMVWVLFMFWTWRDFEYLALGREATRKSSRLGYHDRA